MLAGFGVTILFVVERDSGAHAHLALDVKLVMYKSSDVDNQALKATILQDLSL